MTRTIFFVLLLQFCLSRSAFGTSNKDMDRIAAYMKKTDFLSVALVEQGKRIAELERTVRSQGETTESLKSLIRWQNVVIHSFRQRLSTPQKQPSSPLDRVSGSTQMQYRRPSTSDSLVRNTEHNLDDSTIQEKYYNDTKERQRPLMIATHDFHNSKHPVKEVVSDNATSEETQSVIPGRNKRNNGSQSMPTNVAFSAYLSSSKAIHVHANSPLIFPDVILNDLQRYSPASGVFTCPYNGVYLFTFTIAAPSDKQNIVRLVMDGQKEIQSSAGVKRSFHVQTASSTAILRCHQGQNVWVETENSYTHKDFNVNDRFAIFSGVLLFADA